MVRRQARRTVNIPHNKVWKLLNDLEGPSKFHPMVNHVEITSSHIKGLGASRRIHYVDGSTQTEEVVQIGQGYIIFKPQPFQDRAFGPDFVLTYKVTRLLPTWTEIIIEAKYTLQAGLWRSLRSFLAIDSTARHLTRQFQQILEGIDYYLTTGKEVGKKSIESTTGPTRTSRSNKVVQQPNCSSARVVEAT
jgi:hypothetical protein